MKKDTEQATQQNQAEQNERRAFQNTPEYLYRAIFRMHRGLFFKKLQDEPLFDDTKWTIVHMLCRPPRDGGQPPTQKDIAEELGYSPPAITAAIKDLVKNELVEKKPDHNDLRCNRIAATKKGREAMHNFKKKQQTLFAQMYEGFSEDERAQLSAYYLRICENLVSMGARRPRFLHDQNPTD